ncbi:MAG TPA: alpha/beta fold hydrolase [Burkholderiales bacterium]|nr:alpha/beta fold hydrolase [Burkholderiales bacterium]
MAQGADRVPRALLARAAFGVSPASLGLAFADWWLHLASSPGKQAELARKAARKWLRYTDWLASLARGTPCAACIEPLEQDARFSAPAWQAWPYNAIYQAFLLTQQWWHNATTEVRGVSPHHEAVVNFAARQLLDLVSPSNFPGTNPEVLNAAAAEGGANFVRGAANFADDLRDAALERAPAGVENFVPGRQVACTPGKVVFRNRLIELIQYTPATDSVYAEPVLVVPAWILKYYILDLSPANSLVRYLVERGHTVFMISWKNPGPEDRGLSMHDYRTMGVMDALGAIERIVPGRKVHAAGYCLGGTLLAIAAAAMARDGIDRLASVTLLAAQVDFEEAGELTLFMDESEVSLLEDMMAEQGFLDARQMAGAFQWIRSNDLIWSRRVREYLLGQRPPLNDLAAWNADGTRMPARMQSEYLRRLFLNNELSEGHYQVEGRAIALRDLKLPIFAVATAKDHIAPWRSVYKIHLFTDADVTFVLASGGHNVGIVSPVNGFAGASYQAATRRHAEPYVDPDAWQALAEKHAGSWWPYWQQWLAERSAARAGLPAFGAPEKGLPVLGAAPGDYVMQH